MSYNKFLLAAALVSLLAIPAANAAGNRTANATNSSMPSSPLIGIFRTNQTTSAQTTTPNTTTTANATAPVTASANDTAAAPSASNSTASVPVLVTVGVAIAAAVAYGYYGGRKRRPV